MDGLDKTDRVDRAALSRRWNAAGFDHSGYREAVRIACRERGYRKPDARAVSWYACEAQCPPEPEPERRIVSPDESDNPESEGESAGVSGLSDIPAGWGKLPPTSSLALDLAWVQSERVAVVTGEASVDLSGASTPAPSMSALSWLETSVRAYTLYVQTVAKTLKDEVDEQAMVKRERRSIEEVRALLAEMRNP